MLTLLLLLLWACAMLALWRRRRALAIVMALTSLPLLMGIGPVAQWWLDGIQGTPPHVQTPQWQPSATIIVLGAGLQGSPGNSRPSVPGYSRLLVAAQAFHACNDTGATCRILVSGGHTRTGLPSEAEVYARELHALAIPPQSLVLEDASLNTWQNAHRSAELTRQMQPTQIVLVTSGLHMRRSLQYFRHAGIAAEGLASDHADAMPGLLPTSFNMMLAEYALRERTGILRYHAYNKLGWNEPPALPTHLNPQTTTHASPH